MALYPLFRFLDTNGDGTGTKNATGDYSASPTTFKIVCPNDKGYRFANIVMHMAGVAPFTQHGYGDIVAGLTNGWTIKMSLGGKVIDLLDGTLIKTNEDFEHISAHISRTDFTEAGDSLAAELSISQFDMPLYVNPGDYIEITLNDDFRQLTSHHFIVQGYSN